jgi:hypothetical protein
LRSADHELSYSQKRFRSIVKSAGFDLVDGQVVGADSGRPAPATPAATPKKGRAKKAVDATPKKTPAKKAADGPPSKKQKLSHTAEDSASETKREDDGPGEEDATTTKEDNTSDGTS